MFALLEQATVTGREAGAEEVRASFSEVQDENDSTENPIGTNQSPRYCSTSDLAG
jgi:hypothetical protein